MLACGLIRGDIQARLAVARVAEQPLASPPASADARDELGERYVADDGRLLSQLRSGSLTPRTADGADAVSLRFCNAIGGAVVSSGAGVALADRPKRLCAAAHNWFYALCPIMCCGGGWLEVSPAQGDLGR
jgi:hypothetical protein